jgi:hypothetical protein
MDEFITSLIGFEWIFFIAAALGGILFLVRLITQFFGIGHGLDGVDVSPDNVDAHMGDSDISFKLLSLQGITGFLLMFGLVGLILTREMKINDFLAILGALGAGLLTAMLIQKAYEFMFGLQSSGTLNFTKAIGHEGSVYLTIPADGPGKVQIIFQEKQQVLDAVSASKEEIKTGSRVRVKEVVNGNMLVVEPV